MMKIAIDLQSLVGVSTGLGNYTQQLLKALFGKDASLTREELNGHSFYFFKPDGSSELNTVDRLIWENVALPGKLRNIKADLLHTPAFSPPFFKKKRSIVTVHDLIGMAYPNQKGAASRFYWGNWLPRTLKNADKIIAVSHHTKKDIVSRIGIRPEKICVIHSSGHERFSDHVTDEVFQKTRTRFNIIGRYFLCVGTVEPRKNISGAIQAFHHFQKNFGSHEPFQLVICGSRNFAHGDFFKEIAARYSLQDIIFTDYVDHETLNSLYCGAEALVFPSFYEGFGFPVLEAMASGCPVICSNATSLPEIAGDAAVLIDPHKPAAIGNAMLDIAHDGKLRQKIKVKGKERLSLFSWKKMAAETLAAYESVLC